MNENDIVYRLLKRAEIRRQIKDRKSVKEGKPDRISDLLEEAANEIKVLRKAYRMLDSKDDLGDNWPWDH
jgi:DNA primase large subunit